MYRVTALEYGVRTNDVEEFTDQEDVLRAMRSAAPKEYSDSLQEWFDQGAHEPLTIQESSSWSDLWEYIP